MNETKQLNRRGFLETSGKTAVVLSAMPVAVNPVFGANDTIGVGHIGLGVRGGTLITQVAGQAYGGGIKGTKVVAVCDVYKPNLEKGVERSLNPGVKQYLDYQDLLADPGVDAVVIATPDHWHSKILIDAANAGKAIYIEKGWTRGMDEAKAMRAAIKKNNAIMQLGHQSRESTAGVQAAELIRSGLLGPVTLVRTGRFENNPLGRNIWRWYGWYDYYERPDPAEVINNLDWKRWLGSAPETPFSMEHFWHWRCYWNYGTGIAGDLLSHEIDFVHSVLRLGIPDTCACAGQNNLLDDGREVPDTWSTLYEYEKKKCTVTFDCSMNSCGLIQPPEFRGKDAILRCNDIAQSVTDFDVIAEPRSAKYDSQIQAGKIQPGKPFMKFDPKKTPPQPSHIQNFFDCVHSGQKTKCNEDEAFIEAATLMMAVQAYKQKRHVRWDPEKEDVV